MNDNEDLKCSVCRNDYAVKRRDPRLLRCLCSICEPCHKEQPDPDAMVCGLCGTTEAGRGACVDSVRLNEVILHMANHTPERLLCTNKPDGRKGKMYCFECIQFFCDQCESFHSQLEATRTHLAVYIGDLKSRPLTEWQIKLKCDLHPDYPVSFFCQETKKLICLYCMTKNPGHKAVEVEEAYEIEKENIKNLSSQRLQDAIQAKSDALTQQKKAEAQKQKVKEAFGKLRTTITNRHRYLLQILNYHYGQFKSSHDENVNKLNDQLQQLTAYYEKSMAFQSDPEYQSLVENVPEDTEVLAPESPDSDLVFVQVGLSNLLQEIRSFGSVTNVQNESNC